MNLFRASNAKKMNSLTNVKSRELFIPRANFFNINDLIFLSIRFIYKEIKIKSYNK